jgi:uncharacterized Zn-finger protein
MNTHGHSNTYFCNICGKEFSRPDNKKRHEESHNYAITCSILVSGSSGNILDSTDGLLEDWGL